jgi:hypothetical protein
MKTKEDYYKMVLKNRELVKDPNVIKCVCPNYLCDWHGKCRECISLHRYYNDHIPICLQELVKNKTFIELASIVEMNSNEREKTPLEYRQYIKEMDQKN